MNTLHAFEIKENTIQAPGGPWKKIEMLFVRNEHRGKELGKKFINMPSKSSI